ncbi:hypothetical protein ACFT5B_09445 [Luteimicrobium sp. NPDC057192]|uniref:hypothetical protein n=1 Tax=Luteimicrobium sp. NPDC057192 TaxID=3346042 RepID=UPI00363BC148
MRGSTFERFLPWTGAVAGAAWIGQTLLFQMDAGSPGTATTATIEDHLFVNYAAVGCLVLMGIMLVFFAAALRGRLRSAEAREATYSAISYGGLLLAAAGLSQMVLWSWAMINGAADAHDDQALHVLSFAGYFGFAGMGIGLATTLVATGLGGLSNAALPRWFAIITLVLGLLSALGTAGIPPGGLVNYVLLPVWLATASVVIARGRPRADGRNGRVLTEVTTRSRTRHGEELDDRARAE